MSFTIVVVWPQTAINNLAFTSLSYVCVFVTPRTAACQAPLSSTVSQSLLTFMVTESVMLSNHLILRLPILFLASIFPSIRIFSSESALGVLEIPLQHQSFQWIFRIYFLSDWLVGSPCSPKDCQESSPVPQFESINSLPFKLHYGPTLTSVHDSSVHEKP